MSEFIIFGRWWLVLELIGLAAFPLVSQAAKNLGDRGYCISKGIGILLLSYLAWIISSARLIPFGYVSILVSLCIVGGLSYLVSRRNFSLKELPWKKMLAADLVFVAALAAFALVLRNKPDLYFAYSEDFVDFAFTKSILRTDYFPPQDPWMAGQSLSYYYGGFVIAATLIKISHIPASFAPNLMVATLFALTAAAVYGLVSNLTRSYRYGLLAVLLVCISGYLSGAFQFIAALTKHNFMGYTPLITPTWKDWFLSFNFWDANRIIPGTLNYYPYFTFLQSDMHPPTISIPFQATLLVLITAFIGRSISPFRNWSSAISPFCKRVIKGDLPSNSADGSTIVLGFLIALNLGWLFFIHSWDYPVYAMVLGLAALLFNRTKAGLIFAGTVILASIILFLPYDLKGVGGGFQGLGKVTERTEISGFLEIFAVFLIIIVAMLIIMSRDSRLRGYHVAIFASVGVMAMPVLKFPLLVFLLPAVALPVYFLLCPAGIISPFRERGIKGDLPLSAPEAADPPPPAGTSPAATALAPDSGLQTPDSRLGTPDADRLMLFLLLCGALVIAFAEVLYLQDALRGSVARFNTVFKLYFGAWLLWGLAAALAFKYVVSRLGTVTRYLWLFPAVVLIAASLIHPVASTTAWTSGRHTVFGVNRGTLDGTAYLKSLNPADYDAIAWIDDNIKGRPVILEAPGAPYGYSSRIASLTGLPTVIGWGMHEIMWRNDWAGVGERTNDTDTIYNTRNEAQLLALLSKYNVRYVYVGSLETRKYNPDGLSKFKLRTDLFRPVYTTGGAQILEVIYGS